ncbi:MAG: stage III sporulation protein AF [Lachnospiraceae bacterium]|nr:stage III sporulation protein AF [Lachnospiraceae bacterium]
MDTLLAYIKNIGFFLILVSVVCNALPENSYKKYCKLFCGLVLVVLVITPFNEILNYDGDISDIFQNKSYQSQLMELEANLKLQDEKQFENTLAQYEESLKGEMQGAAANEGLYIMDVSVNYIYTDSGNDDIELQSLDIVVTDIENNENVEKSDDINLDEIHIDDIEININKGDENEIDIDQLSPGDRPKVIKFIDKVAQALGIETTKINVTIAQ